MFLIFVLKWPVRMRSKYRAVSAALHTPQLVKVTLSQGARISVRLPLGAL